MGGGLLADCGRESMGFLTPFVTGLDRLRVALHKILKAFMKIVDKYDTIKTSIRIKAVLYFDS